MEHIGLTLAVLDLNLVLRIDAHSIVVSLKTETPEEINVDFESVSS
jgi:hypothetical protein